MFNFLFQGMKIFFKGNNFFFFNPFICESGKITNSISQGQNIESIVTMLKSNAENIHKRKVVNHVLKSNVQSKGFIRRKVVNQFFQCLCVLDTTHPIPFHE
jgi:hypothetical protein